MFEAGSIIWRIQTVGKDVLKQDLQQSEAAAKQAGTAMEGAGKKTEEMGKKQETAAQKTRRLAKEQAEAARRAHELAAAQSTVGRAMFVVGAAIVAVTAMTVKAAISWESAWAGVTKTVEGTPEELAAVEDGLRGLTKVLPASHTEIAAVAEAAGQLGVQSKNVVAFTKTMIDLGETTNLSANDAATALARFMNVMGTSQDQASNLGSSVVELGNNYATTEAEIVAMATRLSGAAKQIKLTEGQTLGLAAALSSVGIEAEAGGSAMSKVMIDIAASVDKGGDRVEKFAKIAGVSADEFSKKWRTDPGAALAIFVKGLADAETQGGTTLGMLEDLGITEVRMRDALLRSAAASDEFSDAMETGNKAFDENIALQEEAQKRYDTTASKIDVMKNSVTDTAISLGEHLLPAVEAVAGGVAAFSDFVGGMPSEMQGAVAVLSLLIGGIVLAGGVALLAVPKIVAFKAAMATLREEMPQTTSALGKFTGFLGGPWGVAISVALILLGKLIADNAEYQTRVKDLTGTLDENTGAFTANTRAAVARSLQDQGAFENAKKLGVSIETLTDAAMGQADALEEVRQKAVDYNAANVVGEQVARNFGNSVVENVLGAVGREKDALVDAKDAHENLSKATDTNTKSTKSAANAYLDAQKEVEGLAQELDELIDTLNKANGVGQDAITKNIDYQNTLADVDEQIQKAREGQDGYALTLDQSTKAGRENMGMLVDQAKDAQGAADAIFAADKNTDDYRKRLEDSRQALIDRATDLGATADEAEKLADKILKIPTETEWKLIVEKAEAETEMEAFFRRWNGATINLRATGSGQLGSGILGKADGGIVQFANGGMHFANGGMRENHVAQIARAGDMRVWAEPETGGESYIPLSPAKRSTSVPVLAETAARMGFTLGRGDIKVELNLRELTDAQAVGEIVMQQLGARLVGL